MEQAVGDTDEWFWLSGIKEWHVRKAIAALESEILLLW